MRRQRTPVEGRRRKGVGIVSVAGVDCDSKIEACTCEAGTISYIMCKVNIKLPKSKDAIYRNA